MTQKNNDRSRQAFEEWVKAEMRMPTDRNAAIGENEGKYCVTNVQTAWNAWERATQELLPIFETLGQFIKDGCYIKTQDDGEGERFCLFARDGEDMASGKTFRELCVNIVLGRETPF